MWLDAVCRNFCGTVSQVQYVLAGQADRKMNLIRPIRIQVASEKPVDLSGLIVELRVTAGRKNSFHIYSPKTDVKGAAVLGLEDFRGQFTDHFEEALMDYDGSVETAESTVKVSLFDPTWSRNNRNLALAWPLFAHEKTKWRSREQEYNHRISCRNSLFDSAPIFVDLNATSDVHLIVSPREGTGSIVSHKRTNGSAR